MSQNILKKLSSLFPEGYIVGGILRDYFLKRYSCDIDIILPDVNPRNMKQIAKVLDATFFVLDEDTKVYRFITKKEKIQIDISAFVGKDLREDLLSRDFTINALAYPLAHSSELTLKIKTSKNENKTLLALKGIKKKNLIDLAGSLKDIKDGKINITCEESFKEDPLRMLRTFRFAAQFDFKTTKNTLEQVKKHSDSINSVSGERIQDEILKILSYGNSRKYMEDADKYGLLTKLIPQLESARKCAVVYYGKGGVLKHTFNVLEKIEYLLDNLKLFFPKFHKHLAEWKDKKNILKLTVLLHDVAKPKTAKMMGGRLRFFYHEGLGSKMSAEILKNWRFSRNNIRIITSVIKEHLRIGNLASNPLITNRAVYRFFRDTEGFSIPLLLICWADYASYISKDSLLNILPQSHRKPFPITAGGLEREGIKKTLRHIQVINLMLRLFFCQQPKIMPKKLINGNDVMELLEMKSSPKIGEILEKLRIAQVEKKVRTRSDALKFVSGFKNKA